LLHWGVEGGRNYKAGWRLPGAACRPEGTQQYKDRALQTPFKCAHRMQAPAHSCTCLRSPSLQRRQTTLASSLGNALQMHHSLCHFPLPLPETFTPYHPACPVCRNGRVQICLEGDEQSDIINFVLKDDATNTWYVA
jgi:hypothetical protein